MKKWKRSMAVLLSALTLTGLLAGCGGADTSDAAAGQSASAAVNSDGTPVYDTSKTLEISWLGTNGTNIVDNNMVQQLIEEKFNVKIVNTKVDVSNTEQNNLMLNANEMPDTAFLYKQASEMWDKGLVRSIPYDFIETYMPSYAALLDRYPTGKMVNLVPGSEDEYICINGVNLVNLYEGWYSYYRLDWLEEAGIELNGELQQCDEDGRIFFCAEPFTLEEQDEIFAKFIQRTTPEGNTVYAMSGNKDNAHQAFNPIINAFGIRAATTTPIYGFTENEQYIAGYESEKWLDFLEYAADYYEKGYIDPEFTSQDVSKQWEKITAGRAGYWTAPRGYANIAYKDRPPYSLLNADENAKVLITPPEIGADGVQYFAPYMEAPHAFTYLSFVSADVDDEKLARILMIYEWLCFDPEGQIISRFGKEGEHFTWEAEPYESGIVQNTDVTAEVKGELGLGYYNAVFYDETVSTYLSVETYKPIDAWAAEKDYTQIYAERYDILGENSADYEAAYQLYGNELMLIWQEFYMQSIIGQTDPAAEWDNYLARLDAAGIRDVMDPLSKAPLFLPLLEGELEY